MDLLSKEKNLYRVYGLNISSEIKIEEFMKHNNENDIDVQFVLGDMPEHIQKAREEGRITYYSKNEIWFHIHDIASYYVTNGNTVIVEPCENADMQLLNVYLMCSCLGFIMIQREQVAIHGGSVVIDGKGVILTGHRGAGKSTLTTALRQKGYKFLADDVAATYIDNYPYIYPGFPYQKLCEDAMDEMNYDKESHVSFTGDNKTKYMVPDFESFSKEAVKMEAIFLLTVGDVNEVSIEEMKGKDKLGLIVKNIYREEFLPYIGGMGPRYFKKVLDIAKSIKTYKITRPKEGFTVDRQIELIEELIIEEKIEEKVI